MVQIQARAGALSETIGAKRRVKTTEALKQDIASILYGENDEN
jgi:hypothetical protein